MLLVVLFVRGFSGFRCAGFVLVACLADLELLCGLTVGVWCVCFVVLRWF